MLAPAAIYILLPIVGIVAYCALIQRMRLTGVPSPPVFPFFILFFTFGGWLQVLLTAQFWEWSGMASLGVLYLILIAPFLTAFLSRQLWRRRALSRFHKFAFLLSAAYTCLIAVGLPLALGIHFDWLTTKN